MKSDILVIGAGLSGALAANYISHKNKNIFVIEKESYLGGRCASKTINDKIFNYGNLFFRDSHFALIQILESILDEKLEEIRIDYVNLIDDQYHIDSRNIYLPKSHKMDDTIKMLLEDIHCDLDQPVEEITDMGEYFEVKTQNNTYRSKDIVITCPGKTTKKLLSNLDIQIETKNMNSIFTIMAEYEKDESFDFPYYKFINHKLIKEIFVNKKDRTTVIHINDYINEPIDLVRRELILKTVHDEFKKYFKVNLNILDFHKWEFAKDRLISDLEHVYDFNGKKIYLLGDWTSTEKNLNGVADSFYQFIREFDRYNKGPK